jgi:hypothetical protein
MRGSLPSILALLALSSAALLAACGEGEPRRLPDGQAFRIASAQTIEPAELGMRFRRDYREAIDVVLVSGLHACAEPDIVAGRERLARRQAELAGELRAAGFGREMAVVEQDQARTLSVVELNGCSPDRARNLDALARWEQGLNTLQAWAQAKPAA